MRKFCRSLLPKYRAKRDADPGVNPILNHMSGKFCNHMSGNSSRELTW